MCDPKNTPHSKHKTHTQNAFSSEREKEEL